MMIDAKAILDEMSDAVIARMDHLGERIMDELEQHVPQPISDDDVWSTVGALTACARIIIDSRPDLADALKATGVEVLTGDGDAG